MVRTRRCGRSWEIHSGESTGGCSVTGSALLNDIYPRTCRISRSVAECEGRPSPNQVLTLLHVSSRSYGGPRQHSPASSATKRGGWLEGIARYSSRRRPALRQHRPCPLHARTVPSTNCDGRSSLRQRWHRQVQIEHAKSSQTCSIPYRLGLRIRCNGILFYRFAARIVVRTKLAKSTRSLH